jgi:hypothetical protein
MSAPPSEVVRYFWEDARTQQWGELLSQKFCGNVEGLEGGLGGGGGVGGHVLAENKKKIYMEHYLPMDQPQSSRNTFEKTMVM